MVTVGKGESEMQITKLPLTTMFVLIAVLIGTFGVNAQNRIIGGAQTKAEDSWAQENYLTALNIILPAGEIPLGQFPKNVKWIATARILPPFERPEYRLSMQKFYDGKIELAVLKPDGGSIVSQLETLRAKYPDESLEKICSLVSLTRLKITQLNKHNSYS